MQAAALTAGAAFEVVLFSEDHQSTLVEIKMNAFPEWRRRRIIF